MSNPKYEWEDGVIGSGSGLINPNSEDFQILRERIENYSSQMSSEEKMQINISGVKYRMETYLDENPPEEIIPVGKFLKTLIEVIGVSNKDFADYIGLNSSNLSAIFSGVRRLNFDLALKLGNIFDIDPSLWLSIQSKGDLWAIKQGNSSGYERYRLTDLLKNAG
ncbi:MAG: hypothetical protein R3C61_07025 [Bacteroidia bacterium]